jgi:hypothetical protein
VNRECTSPVSRSDRCRRSGRRHDDLLLLVAADDGHVAHAERAEGGHLALEDRPAFTSSIAFGRSWMSGMSCGSNPAARITARGASSP